MRQQPMLILAPMAGYTQRPFRRLARECGADMVVSEMVSARGLVFRNRKTWELLKTRPEERPFAVQLFGSEPGILAEAAQIVETESSPAVIDLNMGCPTPKIVRNGDGAALLREPAKAAAVAKAVVQAASTPVTVKTRLGWDDQSIVICDLARRLEDVGVHWIAIHGRTREQFYTGQADWAWIYRVRQTVSMPVVGNGDISSPAEAAHRLKYSGCTHLMIGRGALGNPWIFAQCREYLSHGVVLTQPGAAERLEAAIRHLQMQAELDGEALAVRKMRAHLRHYLKGFPEASQARGMVNQIQDLQELVEYLKALAVRACRP